MIYDLYDCILDYTGHPHDCKQASRCSYEIGELLDFASEIGINLSATHQLILYNDNINNMSYIILCLYDILKLSDQDCRTVMYEAHKIGSAQISIGSKPEMLSLQIKFENRGIVTSINGVKIE